MWSIDVRFRNDREENIIIELQVLMPSKDSPEYLFSRELLFRSNAWCRLSVMTEMTGSFRVCVFHQRANCRDVPLISHSACLLSEAPYGPVIICSPTSILYRG